MLKRLARKYLEIADENFVAPHLVTTKSENDVDTFAVVGKRALQERKKLKAKDLDNYPYQIISLDKKAKVDIEIEQGMAYTKEGQKATMQELMNTMIQGVQIGAIPPTVLQSAWKRYLEVYQFGATAEFMEDLDTAMQQGTPMSQQQMQQMKIAVLEALKDAGEVGPEASQKRVMENKVGVLEALQQSGLAKGMQPQQPVKESISIAYKDAPEDVKRQMEAEAGFQPSRMQSPIASDQALDQAKMLVELKRQQMADRGKEANNGSSRPETA